MKIIRNRHIPFGDFAAINLCGVLLIKNGVKISPELITHESIHTAQIKELLYLPFYLLYTLEWLVRLILNKGNWYKAYRDISFEKEAYENQHDSTYLKYRRRFAEWRKNKLA